jgi:phage gpG-like protein
MADNVTVKVRGVEGVKKAIAKYQGESRDELVDALKIGGLKVEASAKRDGNIPVQFGRLKASISTNWSGSGMQYGKAGGEAQHQDGVGRPDGPKGLTVVVGTNVKYAYIQEMGHWGDAPKPGSGDRPSTRGRDHTPRKRPQQGFQYLSKAYHKEEGGIKRNIEKSFKP